MSSDARRWQRVRTLFERCVGLEGEDRERVLRAARAEDEGLFYELCELLDLDARDDGRLEPLVSGRPEAGLPDRDVGRRIGPWQLEAVLGRGGMSTVYRARRTDEQFQQHAAVKLVRRGMDTEDILRRFRTERQVLADLDHPGIARLLDGGATGDGRPYLVMEYVQGTPVDRYCDAHALDVDGRLRLFLEICEAVHHAHQHGVIHRDLKPSNILVTSEGRPKLLDFGIAKVLDTAASSGTVDVTVTELRLMTPEYASPEQVRGRAIGPASDVYSLGVVLYELLSGHRPYHLTTRLRHDLEQAICELQPRRPSDVVGRAPDSRRLRTRLAGDLDTIVLMALRKEPERRYASVPELAEDLERSLSGRPVLARPDTWRYRAAKFVRRNRPLVAATLGIVLALVAGLVTSTSSWLGEAEARRETETALRRTRALGLAGAAVEALGKDTLLALLLAREAVRVDRTPETLSRLHQVVGLVRERRVFRPGGMHVDFSPNGDALAASAGGAASLWDLEGGLTRLGGHDGGLSSIRFSPSGKQVLTAGSRDGAARLFDLRGEELARFEHDAPEPARSDAAAQHGLRAAELSPDGWHVLTAGADGVAKVWSLDRPAHPVAVLTGHLGPIRRASFSPDGERILTVSEDGTGRLWSFSAEDGSARLLAALEGHEGPIHCGSFSPTGDLVVTASGDSSTGYPRGATPDRTARVWDLTGREIVRLGARHPDYEVEWATFSPSGTEVLTSSGDRGGRLWDLQGRVLAEYPVPASSATGYVCSFTSDGRFVGFGCRDGSAWLFEVSGAPVATLRGHDDEVLGLCFSPEGRSMATASLDQTVRLWRVQDEVLPTFRGLRGPVRPAISPDGSRVATASWAPSARIWDLRGAPLASLEGHEDSILSIRFDAEGERLVTASADRTARIWDVDGHPLGVLVHPDVGMVRTAAFSPDGGRIATGCNNGSVWLWTTDGDVLDRFPVESWVSHVEFAPGGERLLIALAHRPVLILRLADGSPISLGHQGYHASFTPSGEILIACQDGRVALLTESGDPLREFPAHASVVTWAEMSPDGRRVATASEDGTARIWSADGSMEATLRGHASSVEFALFSPGGDRVLTASSDGTARTWITDPEELVAFADARAVREFSAIELLRYEALLGVPAHEAQALVDRLLTELGDKQGVVAHLREDPGLGAELRESALRFAAALPGEP